MRTKRPVTVIAWPGFAPTEITVPAGTEVAHVDTDRFAVVDDTLVAKLTGDPKRAEGYYVYVPREALS